MKTGYLTRNVANAAFQGRLLFPVFPAVYSAQTKYLFSFQTRIFEIACRPDGSWTDVFPLCFLPRVMRRNIHRDFTGRTRPVFCEKEVPTQVKKPVFHTM